MTNSEKLLWVPGDEVGEEEAEALQTLGFSDEMGTTEEQEVPRKTYEKMLAHMREMAKEINKNTEIKENGFSYPIEWLDDFETELFAALNRGETPDIAIVGYGSLQSPQSLAGTMQAKSTGVVTMEGVKRGLYLSGLARAKADWEEMGLDYHSEQAVMAVKHTPNAICNGVRIPLPNNPKEIEKLQTREFAYELLPGPPATKNNAGDKLVFKLNLLCWPLGRSLMDQYKKDALSEKLEPLTMKKGDVNVSFLDKKQKEIFENLENVKDQREYLQSLSDTKGEDFEKLEAGIIAAYEERVAKLYDLNGRPLPHMSYVKTCLDMGDFQAEEIFLDTTYCYSPKREEGEITLRDYLKKYAPKTNPKVRAGGDIRDGSENANIMRTRSVG